jgi:DNA-directed RNA polymerase subunit RPC12/RpoP
MITVYAYKCADLKCGGMFMMYSLPQVKDVNCPLCTHKTAISNRNLILLDLTEHAAPEPLEEGVRVKLEGE